MQNRSSFPVIYADHELSADFPVFAMRYTQRYQPKSVLHYHNCLELGRCVSGSGTLFLEGEIFPFSAGSVSIVRKGSVHDAHVIINRPDDPISEWVYVFVDLEELGMAEGLSRSFNAHDGELRALFDMLFAEAEKQAEDWQGLFCALLRAFLIKARRVESALSLQGQVGEELSAVIGAIARQYAGELTVASLAKSCALSVSTLRRLFQKELGMSPQQYINRVRLDVAEHLLRTTSKSVLAISEEVGFRTLSSFNRLFRRRFGRTPRDMRR